LPFRAVSSVSSRKVTNSTAPEVPSTVGLSNVDDMESGCSSTAESRRSCNGPAPFCPPSLATSTGSLSWWLGRPDAE
jgi:hypothetical protein